MRPARPPSPPSSNSEVYQSTRFYRPRMRARRRSSHTKIPLVSVRPSLGSQAAKALLVLSWFGRASPAFASLPRQRGWMPRCSSPAARHPTFSVWSAVGGVWRSGWSLLEIDVQGRIGAELVRKSVARLCPALLIASTGSRLQRIYSALRRVLVSRRA